MRSRSFLPFFFKNALLLDLMSGQTVAVKVMEQIADNIEEIEEEFLVLRDLCLHPNIPAFHGLYLKKHATKREEDQLWFVMEVSPLSLFPS